MVRFLRQILRRFGQQDFSGAGTADIDGLLRADMQRLRSVDAETDVKWRQLTAVLNTRPQTEAIRPATGKLRWALAAVSFAVVATVVIVAAVIGTQHPSVMTYETGKGQQSSLTLSDSSEVTLNHTSLLTVDRHADDTVRQVTLNGEAFFRVRSSGKPFTVSTSVGTVRVLGTEFNVWARDDRLEVAVIRGRVQVSVRKNGEDSTVVLTGGQISTCAKGDFPSTPGQLLFSEYPGWMHGKFLFYKTTLQSACKEFESQFDVVIRIRDPRLRNETITGAVDAHSVEKALSTLASLTGNKYRYENNGYTVY